MRMSACVGRAGGWAGGHTFSRQGPFMPTHRRLLSLAPSFPVEVLEATADRRPAAHTLAALVR